MSGGCGILQWGVAVPRRRVQNRATQEAWGRPDLPGCRRVAGHDEDAVTLGVEAAWQAVRPDDADSGATDTSAIDLLIFASTTAPFAEKSCATLIADTLDLPREVRCLDMNTSRRAGTQTLATACDLIRGGTARRVLVVAADTRQARPGSPEECLTGHAGVAVLVGPAEDAKAEIVHHVQYRHGQTDVRRTADARFPLSGDPRFGRLAAYAAPMEAVLKTILQTVGWRPGDVDRVAPYSPDVKSGAALLKKHGFDVKTQYCDRVSAEAGLTGTGHTLLMLVAALEESAAEDRLIALDCGDGAAALAVRVRAEGGCRRFEAAVSRGYDISYNRYLAVQRLHAGADARDGCFTSAVMAERNKRLWRALVGRRCLACGTVLTLPLPTCPRCARPTDFAEMPLQRSGAVFAVTREHYFPTSEPPLGMAVVNLDGGGRLTLQVADEDTPLKIDDRVELVFRCLHAAGGLPNYFWKCRRV